MTTLARNLIILMGFILIWQAIILIFSIPDYLLPTPMQVATVLHDQFAVIAAAALPTFIETMLGFILGILFGCIAALVITFYRPLSYWCLPMLVVSQAIPTFAIAPLLVMWLGYGLASKVATAVLMTFFPVVSALYDGLRKTNPAWVDLAKTMNAKKWRLFFHIHLPAASPALASGIRIAAVIAPIGAVVGEWVGSSQGLGYLMLNANARLQIDMMFAALLVIIVLALALYYSVDVSLRKLIWW